MSWTHSGCWKSSGPSTLSLISLECDKYLKYFQLFRLLAINMFHLQPLLNILNEYLLVPRCNIHLVPSNHYWNILRNTYSWSVSKVGIYCFILWFLTELATFQSCLICLIMSSLVLTMVRDVELLTENTSKKACPEIIERCRMAGNWE